MNHSFIECTGPENPPRILSLQLMYSQWMICWNVSAFDYRLSRPITAFWPVKHFISCDDMKTIAAWKEDTSSPLRNTQRLLASPEMFACSFSLYSNVQYRIKGIRDGNKIWGCTRVARVCAAQTIFPFVVPLDFTKKIGTLPTFDQECHPEQTTPTAFF